MVSVSGAYFRSDACHLRSPFDVAVLRPRIKLPGGLHRAPIDCDGTSKPATVAGRLSPQPAREEMRDRIVHRPTLGVPQLCGALHDASRGRRNPPPSKKQSTQTSLKAAAGCYCRPSACGLTQAGRTAMISEVRGSTTTSSSPTRIY